MESTKQATLCPAKAPPALNLPPGASVKVQIIDTTSRIRAPVSAFMLPGITGHECLQAPAFSFLVEQPSTHRKVVFDLGLRKDWENLPPVILNQLKPPHWAVNVEKNVAEILQDSGIDVAGGAIEAVIWSHWHFDHTGDVSSFPASTILVGGAGVRDNLFPTYPTAESSPLAESDFTGREYREIDFQKESTGEIAPFKFYDYFKDGSFYLLDAPGHAIGHLCGLARVTSVQEGDAEDTFVMMGADTAHHGGAIRPNAYFPLPREISPSPLPGRYPLVCPGHLFEAAHPEKSASEPFYRLNNDTPHNRDQAVHSLEALRQFDAAENVFVIIAHDDTLLNPEVGIEWFPHGSLKNWKVDDLATKARWRFLKDFTGAVEASEKS